MRIFCGLLVGLALMVPLGAFDMRAAAGTRVFPPALVMPPLITNPGAGDTVGMPIVVRGAATAGHRVVVQVDFRMDLQIVLVQLATIQGSYGESSAAADAAGSWEVLVRPAIHVPILSRTQVTITATAIDSEGRRSLSNWVIAWLR